MGVTVSRLSPRFRHDLPNALLGDAELTGNLGMCLGATELEDEQAALLGGVLDLTTIGGGEGGHDATPYRKRECLSRVYLP
jgi:hypothetical protein